MRFQLRTTGWIYPKDTEQQLQALGFVFTINQYGSHKDLRAPCPTIDLATIEELTAFCRIWGDVIVSNEAGGTPTLEIYDDARE